MGYPPFGGVPHGGKVAGKRQNGKAFLTPTGASHNVVAYKTF